MSLSEGDSFGHYQILGHIAQGGTGDVYRALNVQTRCEVALKIPTKETLIDPSKHEFFLREVDALRVLHHPAVQRALEDGRLDYSPFLATELIDGKSLRRLIKEGGAFPLDRALVLIRRIAEGLAYCHAQGVIHRDIKPENILVNTGDDPVIIDFGLAISPARPTMGSAAGTPDYVSPEQIQGRRVDQRTDIYALGAVFCELLTGAPPYVGADPLVVLNMHQYSPIPRLDQIKRGISPQLATVVARCLQRDPALRYPDVLAFLHDLDHPDQVDTSQLDRLIIAPPKPPFYRNPMVQAVLFSFVLMFGIVVLAVLLAGLKH